MFNNRYISFFITIKVKNTYIFPIDFYERFQNIESKSYRCHHAILTEYISELLADCLRMLDDLHRTSNMQLFE